MKNPFFSFTTENTERTEKKSSSFLSVFSVLSVVSLFFTACSLAGDVTPPSGFEEVSAPPPAATLEPPTAAPQDTGLGYPTFIPSAAEGAFLYAQNCTRCHGSAGKGDGEMASQIQFPLPDFTSPDLARSTTPVRWFDIITNGNLERVMPPWGDTLTEAERWNLVAYLYTLSASQSDTGRAIYAANCANCHGENGRGDGPDARSPTPDFVDQQFMAAKSNDDFYTTITEGINGEHKYDSLTDDARRAVVDYLRAFSYESASAAVTGGVTGKLINGTAGAALPADLPVVLHIFDDFTETGAITETVTSDGTFVFPDIELRPNRAFIVSAEYGGVIYVSDVAAASPSQSVYDLPIKIFETTTDPSAIAVERMHIIFDFRSDRVQVGELFILSNNGDTALAAAKPGEPTVSFALPTGYSDLAFQDGEIGGRYLQTADGFADTAPIQPGQGRQQILVSFTLRYTDALTLTQKISYPTSAVTVLLPDNGVEVSGSALVDNGVRDIQGASYRTFAAADLKPGSVLSFTLSGKPAATAPAAAQTASTSTFDMQSLLIGGLALALAVAVVAYGWVQIRPATRSRAVVAASRPRADQTNVGAVFNRDKLLDQIADLDDHFEAGELSEAEYRAKREELKDELRKKMRRRDAENTK